MVSEGTSNSRGHFDFVKKKLKRIGLILIVGAVMVVMAAFLLRLRYGHIAYFAPAGDSTRDTALHQEIRTNLEQTIRVLAGTNGGSRHLYGTNALKLQAAADWITGQFKQMGYDPTNFYFTIDSNKYSLGRVVQSQAYNIIVERRGTNDSADIIVVGAHYDTMPASMDWTGTKAGEFRPEEVGTPGANDNASGIAALLEIARSMTNALPHRTVRFVAFANEEPPFFQKPDAMGSYLYAQWCTNQSVKIKMMISLDALAVYDPTNRQSIKRSGLKGAAASFWGIPDEPNYVAFMSNWTADSGRQAKEWAQMFAKHSRMAVRTASLPFINGEYFAWSDDWSFTRHGYPAFTVTDTAFYRSARYHELSDSITNLTETDFAGFADVVLGLNRTIWEMANK